MSVQYDKTVDKSLQIRIIVCLLLYQLLLECVSLSVSLFSFMSCLFSTKLPKLLTCIVLTGLG